MPTTPRVAVVADDLTSAADSCGPFVRRGGSAVIQLEEDRSQGGDVDVLAVDLDTRRRSPEAAEARIVEAVRQRAGAPILFKSVDSTLRGHLAVEILAATRCAGRRATILAPAFPAQGRTTSGGVQHLGGTPVHRTDVGRDASDPVHTSTLTEIVPGARRITAGSWPRSGGVLVADAENDADLDALVACFPHVEEVLWVGSPGLAAALARTIELRGGVRTARVRSQRVLLVVGSRQAASRRQLDIVAERGAVVVDVGRPGSVEGAQRALATGGLAALIDTTSDSSASSSEARLASVADDLAKTGSFDGLVLTGGATAAAVLNTMQFSWIDVLDEIGPGIVLGLAHGSRGPVGLALKAGGFGDAGSLHDLVRTLGTTQEGVL